LKEENRGKKYLWMCENEKKNGSKSLKDTVAVGE
jgi:hypothetical protein